MTTHNLSQKNIYDVRHQKFNKEILECTITLSSTELIKTPFKK